MTRKEVHKQRDSRSTNITTWKQFARNVRSRGCSLLDHIDEFPDSVLVTGCQRSGTTILSRIITQSDGMVNYWFGRDDELDAALILSGYVEHQSNGRHCFQTTYLNECFQEYFRHETNYKIIWVLRNPFSVVYSLLHNWRRFALNELFKGCGAKYLSDKERRRYEFLGLWGVGRLQRACLSYVGKVSQLFELVDRLDNDQIMVVDYDRLVNNKENILPEIYAYIGLSYKQEYSNKLHNKSVDKVNLLSARERSRIEDLCVPVYTRALEQCTSVSPSCYPKPEDTDVIDA